MKALTIDERRLNQRHTISEDGFLLFCPQPVDVDSIWQVRVLAANDKRLKTLLTLGAECLWSRPADESNHCWAGFHIIDITVDDTKKLQALLTDQS